MSQAAHNPSYVFFGTPDIAVTALEEMARLGFYPSLVVTSPDARVGRTQVLTPPPVKVWAKAHNIPVLQPASLTNLDELPELTATQWDFFVVFAYGKLIPASLLNLPTHATINAHPSLLPKLRGASPIRSTLLYDLSAAGVTIIKMDEELDHGPILAHQAIHLNAPIKGRELDHTAGKMCGDLLVHVMNEYQAGTLIATEQTHSAATYCTKITKDMAELTIDPFQLPTGEAAFAAYRAICAFDGWPGAYFFYNNVRINITDARLTETGSLEILEVTPAGKKTQPFSVWLHNQRR